MRKQIGVAMLLLCHQISILLKMSSILKKNLKMGMQKGVAMLFLCLLILFLFIIWAISWSIQNSSLFWMLRQHAMAVTCCLSITLVPLKLFHTRWITDFNTPPIWTLCTLSALLSLATHSKTNVWIVFVCFSTMTMTSFKLGIVEGSLQHYDLTWSFCWWCSSSTGMWRRSVS